MPVNSRAKGARGERDAASAWRSLYPNVGAMRGQQRSGLEQADVVDVNPGLHIEVKRYKTFSIWKHIKQMRRDAKAGQIPVLMFRPDGDKDWHIAVSLSHLTQFADIIKGIADDRTEPDVHQNPAPTDR